MLRHTHQFRDRQEMDDAHSYSNAAHPNPDKIPGTRPDNRDNGLEGSGVNHSGYRVGGIMKTIDKFEEANSTNGHEKKQQMKRRQFRDGLLYH